MDAKCLSIVVGSIMGDGHLTNTLKSQLCLKYDNKSLPYLKWLHKELAPIGVRLIKPKPGYHQHQFRTLPSPEMGMLRKLFYPSGIKIVPDEIFGLLISPLSVAIWYMDDGNLDFRDKYHRSPSFATYNFSQSDCEKLRMVFLKNFSIECSVHKSTMRSKVYYRLYVLSKSTNDFFKLVSPHIHSCLFYKVRPIRTIETTSSRGDT